MQEPTSNDVSRAKLRGTDCNFFLIQDCKIMIQTLNSQVRDPELTKQSNPQRHLSNDWPKSLSAKPVVQIKYDH